MSSGKLVPKLPDQGLDIIPNMEYTMDTVKRYRALQEETMTEQTQAIQSQFAFPATELIGRVIEIKSRHGVERRVIVDAGNMTGGEWIHIILDDATHFQTDSAPEWRVVG